MWSAVVPRATAELGLGMPDVGRIASTRKRVQRCQENLGNFVRIQEEMLLIRTGTMNTVYRKRIDGMLKMYLITISTMRRSLQLAEDELIRLERDLGKCP